MISEEGDQREEDLSLTQLPSESPPNKKQHPSLSLQ
jgi:hypothetical protein